MKLYKLPIVLYEPSEDTNDMFMAEAPLLPGCRYDRQARGSHEI